jgi:hypothetical protein
VIPSVECIFTEQGNWVNFIFASKEQVMLLLDFITVNTFPSIKSFWLFLIVIELVFGILEFKELTCLRIKINKFEPMHIDAASHLWLFIFSSFSNLFSMLKDFCGIAERIQELVVKVLKLAVHEVEHQIFSLVINER